MRITENFLDPLAHDGSGREVPAQFSLVLKRTAEGEAYIEFDLSNMTPRVKVGDIDTLIGMLASLQRRADRS